MSIMRAGRYDSLAWPPASGDWTVDDLADAPDDGQRYELFDGVLVVSPAEIVKG